MSGFDPTRRQYIYKSLFISIWCTNVILSILVTSFTDQGVLLMENAGYNNKSLEFQLYISNKKYLKQ